LLHWRYQYDPPEFFTILSGNTDRLHWGYWLDDPAQGPACTAYYWGSDAHELHEDNLNLFAVFRAHLEKYYADTVDIIELDPDHADDYDRDMQEYERLRELLPQFHIRERPEIGEEYLEGYDEQHRRGRVVAKTVEGMGVVVRPDQYRAPRLDTERLYDNAAEPIDIQLYVEEARQACAEGFPGTALKIGRDLWPLDDGERDTPSVQALDLAYAALERPLLREVLRLHNENRVLPSVDILDSRYANDR
jgi:hypothetical protein